MQQLIDLVQKVRRSPALSKKFFFLMAIFVACRLLAHVPVPMIDVTTLRGIFDNSQLLSIFNIFSGGTLANFSIVALGVSPYISSSIVLQLAGLVFPKLKELQKDGERGRQKINQYTRYLTLPLALMQSISIIALLSTNNLLLSSSWLVMVNIAIILTGGAFLMTWLGELITQYGLGNGVSMIMTLGIVSQIPTTVARISATTSAGNWLGALVMIVVVIGVVALVAMFNEAARQVTIQYAKRIHGNRVTGGQTTFLPIKVNATGVMPIIFGLTLMAIPPFLGQLLLSFPENATLVSIGQFMTTVFAQDSWSYLLIYFAVVFAFTYFSAVIFFNAEDIADELKKSGAFVPGVRPGEKTKNFLSAIVNRLTLVDAIFMSLMALIPFLLQMLTQIDSLAIGGTSILILVSVILETTKQIEGQTVSQNYAKYQ
jgi:preprotein translocase subunit SecY